jgi:hypothetical protein
MTTPHSPSEALLRRRLLGWDVRSETIDPAVDLGRDLRLRRGPHGVDLDTVEGIDCVAQDLAHALTTLLGSDVLNTTFGFDGLAALAAESEPILVRERIRVGIVNMLNRDPRIRRIVDVKFEDDRLDVPVAGDGVGNDPDTRELSVRVSFETVTDEQVHVNLGRLPRHG